MYEFAPLDEEEQHGEGRLIALYPDEDSALRTASGIGGSPDQWVNAGVVQDEYADLRQALDQLSASGSRNEWTLGSRTERTF